MIVHALFPKTLIPRLRALGPLLGKCTLLCANVTEPLSAPLRVNGD